MVTTGLFFGTLLMSLVFIMYRVTEEFYISNPSGSMANMVFDSVVTCGFFFMWAVMILAATEFFTSGIAVGLSALIGLSAGAGRFVSLNSNHNLTDKPERLIGMMGTILGGADGIFTGKLDEGGDSIVLKIEGGADSGWKFLVTGFEGDSIIAESLPRKHENMLRMRRSEILKARKNKHFGDTNYLL